MPVMCLLKGVWILPVALMIMKQGVVELVLSTLLVSEVRLLTALLLTALSSSQLQAPPLVSLPAGLGTHLSWSPGLPHRHHQLAMKCSVRQQLVTIPDAVQGTLATLSWHWLDWHWMRHTPSLWWVLEKRGLLCYRVVRVTQPRLCCVSSSQTLHIIIILYN